MADSKKTAKVSKKAEEIKTVATLTEELLALQAANLESRKSHKQGELVNPHVLTVQRKDIARAHTAIAAARAAELSTLKEEK
jgi:ribosomal protein L29